jgi:hypothetical protein
MTTRDVNAGAPRGVRTLVLISAELKDDKLSTTVEVAGIRATRIKGSRVPNPR